MALDFTCVKPTVVIRVVRQHYGLPARAQPILINGERQRQDVVPLSPLAAVTAEPVGRRFTRRPRGLEYLDYACVSSLVPESRSKKSASTTGSAIWA